MGRLTNTTKTGRLQTNNVSQPVKTPFDATKTGIAVNTIKGLPKAGLDTLNKMGQASFRGFGAIGAKIANRDINAQFKPEGTFQKELYGTEKPVDFTSVGQEVTQKNVPVLTPAVGAFLSVADAIPGGSGIKNTLKAEKNIIKPAVGLLSKAKNLYKNSILSSQVGGIGKNIEKRIADPIRRSEVDSLMSLPKKAVSLEADPTIEKQLFSQMDKNVMSAGNEDIKAKIIKGRLQPRDAVGKYSSNKPRTVDGEIMNSGRLGQKSIANTPNINAPIINTSNRIMPESIPQKKGILQRMKEAYKNSPLSSQKGSIGGKMEKRIQTELEITQDALDNHPAKDLIKYTNKRTSELPQVTGGVKSKFGNRGDDIVTELGYEDTSKLSDSIDEYRRLQAKAKDLKQQVTNERIAKVETIKNDRMANQPLKYSAEGRPLALNAREKAIVSRSSELSKDIPQTVVPKGEAQSLEALANQSKTVDGVKIPSLPDIIKTFPTPVNKKINIVDYIRTPDRVLEKIGFADEAKSLRKSYEAYSKELPTNINKITEWSKQVSADSNEKIFKFLDGQGGNLDANEARVASEIKSWLSTWADRLNLPQDNRISHYITHIFDKELLTKEFDEDLAKIIANKIPGEVYDPFLLRRLGAKGYKQDTWQALDAYVKRATRKAHLDPVLEQIKAKTGSSLERAKIEASQFKYIQRYINNVNMRPTELDTVLDNGIKSLIGYKLGQRPITALTKSLRQLTFRGMLGLNPGSALRNLSQGINTYATLGEKYTVVGYSKLFSKSAMQELKDVGVLADSFIQDRTLSATKKSLEQVDKVLFSFFNAAEKINRGSAYFGAKSKALAEGKSLEQAIEYGKEIVRKTQFNFSSIDTPVALQNDLAKTLLQFQTYTVKQTEFLTEMVKDKNFLGLLRYAVGGLAFVYTAGQAIGMKPEQLLPQFRFDTPPSLKVPTTVAGAIANTPDKYGQQRDLAKKLDDVGQSLIGIVPAGSQIKKTYQGIKSIQEGGSYDKGGKLQYKQDQSTGGRLQSILFGKSSSKEAQNYFDKVPTPEKQKAQQAYTQVQVLVKDNKQQEAKAIVDSLTEEEYSQYKKVKSSEKAKATKEGKRKLIPTFNRVRRLIDDGKENEARAIVDSLTDQEYEYYKLLKKDSGFK